MSTHSLKEVETLRNPAERLEQLADALDSLPLTEAETEGVLSRIADDTTGLLLYGSRARGDYLSSSDFDLLRVANYNDSATLKIGRVSVSSYTRDELASASSTLFGAHLKRDGRILLDSTGELAHLLETFTPPDPAELLRLVKHYSGILNMPDAEKQLHCPGLAQLARYLLRTATYALAISEGRPCFSVRELAQRYNDPALATVLASDPAVTGPATRDKLEDLTDRLLRIVGEMPQTGYKTLNSLAVATWDSDRNLAALAILAASEDEAESLDYSDLPKVLL